MKNTLILLRMCFMLAVAVLMPALPAVASGGEPTTQIKQTVDAVIETLKDRDLKKPARKEQRRRQIRLLVHERFDFEEMSKRSLTTYWKKLTPEEQKEFVSLYSDLLESTYIKKIERYENERVLYKDEKVDGSYAFVKTGIVTTKEVEIPVDYRLLNKNGKWEIYDVVIEGVSLINNYRAQFTNIMRTGSYQDLAARLRGKNLPDLQ